MICLQEARQKREDLTFCFPFCCSYWQSGTHRKTWTDFASTCAPLSPTSTQRSFHCAIPHVDFIVLMSRYGVVLREQGMIAKATEMLARSLRAYPWNWSAWLDLAALPTLDWSTIAGLDLPLHIMRYVCNNSSY